MLACSNLNLAQTSVRILTSNLVWFNILGPWNRHNRKAKGHHQGKSRRTNMLRTTRCDAGMLAPASWLCGLGFTMLSSTASAINRVILNPPWGKPTFVSYLKESGHKVQKAPKKWLHLGAGSVVKKCDRWIR